MENEPWYLFQLFSHAWEATESGAFVIDLFLAFFVVLVVRRLEKLNKLPQLFSFIIKHPILEDDKLRLIIACLAIFCLHVVFIAPYSLYKENKKTIYDLNKKVDEGTIKLNGRIDQWMFLTEPNTTNVIIFPQMQIYNSGAASMAGNFNLEYHLGTNSIQAKPIDFQDFFEWQTQTGRTITVFRLYRKELLSEKTSTAIERGSAPRGWLAFRINRKFDYTQIKSNYFVISFLDVTGKEIFATNGFWNGNQMTNFEYFYIPKTLAGSVNLVWTNYDLPIWNVNGWLPPELPLACDSVFIRFGTSISTFPRLLAETLKEQGQKINIADIPDSFSGGLANLPPRQKEIYMKSWMQTQIGNRTFPFPVQPVIVSNRLYLNAEMPFSNEKHKIVMNDLFDSELSIPDGWDRNYSTNYDVFGNGVYAYEIVNELQNPVLQVVYASPNAIQVNGIFQVGSNSIFAAFDDQPKLLDFILSAENPTNGTRMATLQADNFHESLIISSNETITEFGRRFTNEFFRPIFHNQRRIFKYPSNRHLGEFSDFETSNKRDTNIIDNP